MQKFLLSIFLCLNIFFATAQEYTLQGNEIVLSKPINFKTGTAELLPNSEEGLMLIKNYLITKSYVSLLRVEAHVDNTRDTQKNQQLTQKRALAICKQLVAMGVDCKRLIAVGFGDTKPVADNSTMEGKLANKRVHFINVALRGKLIGGMPADGNGVVAGDVCN